MSQESTWAPIDNPILLTEMLSELDPIYYLDEDNDGYQDAGLYELQRTEQGQELSSSCSKLKRLLSVVSRELYHAVLQRQSSYARELKRVTHLHEMLVSCTDQCKSAREHVNTGRECVSTVSLRLLHYYKRRARLLAILRALRTLSALRQTDTRITTLLEAEDYAGAVQLCVACQQAAAAWRSLSCVRQLAGKLGDTLACVEARLDRTLARVCGEGFNADAYSQIMAGYNLLGRPPQLPLHFAAAVHQTARRILLGYVRLSEHDSDEFGSASDMCKLVAPQFLPGCLRDLCAALYRLMRGYHTASACHSSSESYEAIMVKKKLTEGRERVWRDVAETATLLLQQITNCDVDDFMRVLRLIDRLILVGSQFCQVGHNSLQDSLRRLSLQYVQVYHAARFDELRMFMETELWHLCPVTSDFSADKLQEFKLLKVNLSNLESEVVESYFDDSYEGDPFALSNDGEEEKEDFMTSTSGVSDNKGSVSDDSEDEHALHADFIAEDGEENYSFVRSYSNASSNQLDRQLSIARSPLIANTTLFVLRLIGKYMCMMQLLRCISFDIVSCIFQIFDFYLLAVHNFFVDSSSGSDESMYTQRLRFFLDRVQRVVTTPPCANSLLCLTDPNNLYGFIQRMVACESLVFLANQLNTLRPYIEAAIPNAKHQFLHQFYVQTVGAAVDLRGPVYSSVAVRALNYSKLLEEMATVKWDINEIMSQQSPYVSWLLEQFRNLQTKLNELSHEIPLARIPYQMIIEQTIRLTNWALIEGFASVKRCTQEGRALMQLDFQMLMMELEKQLGSRSFPDRDAVDGYIKAFYLPETEFERWISDHRNLSSKHIISLVNNASSLQFNKKLRNKLLLAAEDTERRR